MLEKDPWADVLKGSSNQDSETSGEEIEWNNVLGMPSNPKQSEIGQILGLNENRNVFDHEQYRQILAEYSFKGTPENCDFWNDDPNTGYKLHLNVAPSNVVKVSDFLKRNGYEHKYLTGGEIEDGKIFTVYTGSKKNTDRIVKEIHDGVGDLLEEPKAFGEVEYAPKIVGRFRGNVQYFRQYGRDGITLLNDLPQSSPQNTVERARQKAVQLYGKYFTG